MSAEPTKTIPLNILEVSFDQDILRELQLQLELKQIEIKKFLRNTSPAQNPEISSISELVIRAFNYEILLIEQEIDDLAVRKIRRFQNLDIKRGSLTIQDAITEQVLKSHSQKDLWRERIAIMIHDRIEEYQKRTKPSTNSNNRQYRELIVFLQSSLTANPVENINSLLRMNKDMRNDFFWFYVGECILRILYNLKVTGGNNYNNTTTSPKSPIQYYKSETLKYDFIIFTKEGSIEDTKFFTISSASSGGGKKSKKVKSRFLYKSKKSKKAKKTKKSKKSRK
jgi:hypothetical protein